MKKNGRYFYGLGNKGQALTAWSLMGARIFCSGRLSATDLSILDYIEKKKGFYRYSLKEEFTKCDQ